MAALVLILLIIFYFLGYIRVPGFHIPDIPLFEINHHIITLWGVLILLLISSLIEILPSPLRQVAGFLLILWILSIFGVITLVAFPHIIIVSLVVGLILFLLGVA